jgi:hypothetical protein
MVDGIVALVAGVGLLLAGLAEAVGAVACAGGKAAAGIPAGFPAVRGVAPLAADVQLLSHVADALPRAVL